MKILQVSCSAYPFHNSGVSVVIKNISEELLRQHQDVLVYTMTFDKKYENNTTIHIRNKECDCDCFVNQGTIEDFYFQYEKSSYLNENKKLISSFKETLNLFKPDIVHFHSIQGLGVKLISLAKECGSKVIVTMHDWWWLCPFSFMADIFYSRCNQKNIDFKVCSECVNKVKSLDYKPRKMEKFDNEKFIIRRKKILFEILNKEVDLILTVSDFLAEFLRYNFPEIIYKIVINENGVEFPKCVKNLHNDYVTYGFLGGFSELKGSDTVIKCFKELINDGYKVKLKVFGAYSKGSLLKNIISKIIIKFKNMGMDIMYYNKFDENERDTAYNKFDVLISYSKVLESSSLVVREALIRNKPVISSDSGGPEEVIDNEVNGLIVKSENVDDLKKAIIYLSEKDNYNNMKNNMKNKYTYTFENQANELISIYRKVIKNEFD